MPIIDIIQWKKPITRQLQQEKQRKRYNGFENWSWWSAIKRLQSQLWCECDPLSASNARSVVKFYRGTLPSFVHYNLWAFVRLMSFLGELIWFVKNLPLRRQESRQANLRLHSGVRFNGSLNWFGKLQELKITLELGGLDGSISRLLIFKIGLFD